jgi:hypothetical protein
MIALGTSIQSAEPRDNIEYDIKYVRIHSEIKYVIKDFQGFVRIPGLGYTYPK